MSVSVCIALLAASAAVSSAYAAADKFQITKTAALSSSDRGYAALVNGRNAAAIKSYSRAIESRKLPAENLARALLNRALAYQNSGHWQHAIDDYTAAIRLDALSSKIRAVALYNRGLAHEKAKQPAMAIEDFTGALLMDPGLAQAYYSRANVLRQHGQYLLAIADYKKARHFKHSQKHLTYFGEALTYEALNQKTVAKALLLKAVAAKPDFTAARNKLAGLPVAKIQPVAAAPTPRKPVRIAMVSPDALITGSVAPSKPDLTLRKTSLPKPVGVPKNIKSAAPAVQMPPLPDITNLVPKNLVTKKQASSKTAAKAPAKAKVIKVAKAPVISTQNTASGWTVQLSSQRNSDAAWDVWKNLSTRYSSILKGQKPAVVKADLGSRGIFYRLRVHDLDSKRKAARLCNKLKRKGSSCYVTKA